MDTLIAETCTYIQTHLATCLPTDDLAARVHMSRITLYRRFKGAKGMPVAQFIRDCRMAEGRRLLSETVWPLDLIAELVGYSRRHFTRLFTALHGESPRAYRRQRGVHVITKRNTCVG